MAVLDPATSPLLDPVTAPPKPSVFEDFIDIFYAPRQVFARRRDGEFFLALVALVVVMGVFGALFYNLLAPGYDAMADMTIAQARAKDPRINDDAARAMRGFIEMTAKFGAVVFLPLAALLGALGIWIVGKFFDATHTFGQSLTVSTYSLFPLLIAAVVMAVMSFVVAPEGVQGLQSYMLSPARMLDAKTANPGLLAALMRIDPFQVWSAWITGVGISELGRVSLGKGLGAATVVWLIGTLLQAGPAAMR